MLMCRPVDKSFSVYAPQRMELSRFYTYCSMLEVSAELQLFSLNLTR